MPATPAAAWRWVVGLVAGGLALRVYHFLRDPSVWHDEAAMIVNALHVPYSDMLGPLRYDLAVPPLFLAAERAVAGALGDGTFALRLLPFLAGCLALVLFAGVAWRLLAPAPAALAVGLFAVADRLLWHGCEAKSYPLDVLAAVALAWAWQRTAGWPLAGRAALFAASAPAVLWASFPACFLYGGLLLTLLPEAVRSRSWRDRAAYLGLAAAVVGAFVPLALGPVKAQRTGAMESCWVSHFPDYGEPLAVPVWAAGATLGVVRYALFPLGQLLLPLAVAGGVALVRAGRGREVAVLLLPLALAFAAACVHKYPYGCSRLEVFAAPGLVLAVAAGAGWALPRLRGRARWAAWGAAVLLAVPFGYTAYRVAVPWPRADCDAAAAFVRGRAGPGDGLLFNHVEYEYYFRDVPDRWVPWRGVPPAAMADRAGTVWAVVTATELRPDERAALATAPGWAAAERREFRFTTVVRFERDDRAHSTAAAASIP